MSKRVYFVLVVMVAMSFVMFSGCSKPPTQEMTAAEKAMEDAKQKEAPAYVPDLFAKAESSFNQAKDFVSAKKYKEAKQAALDTQTFANQAAAGVEAAKNTVKAEAEQNAQDVQKGVDDLKALVAANAKNKKFTAVREEVQAVITKTETDFAAVKEKLQSGKMKEANDELKKVKFPFKTN